MTQDWASRVAGRLNHKIGVHGLPSQNYQFIKYVQEVVLADKHKNNSRNEGAPHTSFHHRDSTENSQPRESIEVQALVFYGD